jgi:hypothetical protein
VKFASSEFERLWIEGISILPIDVEGLRKETFLNNEFTPFEVYIKFLIEYFGKSVEFDPNAITDLPDGFKRLSYQIDAVNEGFKLLQKHNGFFLADVVGLGKTVVGTLIAKKFFYSNDFPSHITNTLIVVPPALKDNWVETLDKFQLQNYTIVTNGSLHKITDADKYDLIVLDEAHKFRNDTADAYNDLQKICKTRTRHRLKDGSFANKKVKFFVCKQFRYAAFPKSMDTFLIAVLTIVIAIGMERHMRICNVVTYLCTIFHDFTEIFFFKCLGKPAKHRLNMPRYYAKHF